MATAANGPIVHSRLVHVFEQLDFAKDAPCELCKEQPAAFHWTERRDGKERNAQDTVICRICAGMILLIGKGQ